MAIHIIWKSRQKFKNVNQITLCKQGKLLTLFKHDKYTHIIWKILFFFEKYWQDTKLFHDFVFSNQVVSLVMQQLIIMYDWFYQIIYASYAAGYWVEQSNKQL